MTFTVSSNSFKDGVCRAILPFRPISVSAAPAATNRRISRGRVCRRGPRASRSHATIPTPDRLGLLALAGREYSSERERACRGRGPVLEQIPPGALQTRTDFGTPGYGGPCPPPGDHPHRYLFTVFAVKADKLDVKPDTSAAVVGFNLHFNTLAKAQIMGLFKR